MRIFKGLFLLFLLWASTALAQNNSLNRVRVQGNRFVTAEGKPIVFRGLDTSDPDKRASEGHWNREYFQEMKNWGANVVRFPVHPNRWRQRGQEAYLKLLDEGVAMA